MTRALFEGPTRVTWPPAFLTVIDRRWPCRQCNLRRAYWGRGINMPHSVIPVMVQGQEGPEGSVQRRTWFTPGLSVLANGGGLFKGQLP